MATTIDPSPVLATLKGALPALHYPITTVDQVKAASTGATVSVSGHTIALDSVLAQLPTTSFPIASAADLQQKATKLVTQRAADASKAVTQITALLPPLKFPIANAAELLAQTSTKTYTVNGKTLNLSSAVALMPASDFPLASQADFDTKTSAVAFQVVVTTSGPGSLLK